MGSDRADHRRMYQAMGANASDFEDHIAWLSHHDSPEYRATIKYERDKISAKITDRSIPKQLTDDSYESTIPRVAAHEEIAARIKKQTRSKSKSLKVPYQDDQNSTP
ncbi:hypothetical protein G7Y79_00037g072940 [Physcia stellaris]|nr:hypothetical protein G7Y79_00037g072940 [Physcia stellaris]